LHSTKWSNGGRRNEMEITLHKKNNNNSIEDLVEMKKMDTQFLTPTKQ
jgi:hypothetical protein